MCLSMYTYLHTCVMSLVWMSHVSSDKAIILPLYIAPILTPYAPGSPRDDIAASWSKRLSACDVCRASECGY